MVGRPLYPHAGQVRQASWSTTNFTSHSGGTCCTFTSHSGGTCSTFTSHSGGTYCTFTSHGGGTPLHPSPPPTTGWPAPEARPLLHGTRTATACCAATATTATPPPGTVFPGPATRVFARPGEDSTSSGRPPRVRRPPAHLDLYDTASMASRSGGSHVESPVAVSPLRPLCRRGNTVPPSPATISSWRR